MQKWIVSMLVVCGLAVSAMGQVGLQVADTADVTPQGSFNAVGGLVKGDDTTFLGARANYGLFEGLNVFADLGLLDFDEGDSGPAFQAGALYSLPLELEVPVELAARGTIFMASIDNVTITGITAAGVGSLRVSDLLTVYAALGFNHSRAKIDGWGGTQSETDPLLSGGVMFKLNDQFSAYVELSHIDDFFFGGGAVVNL